MGRSKQSSKKKILMGATVGVLAVGAAAAIVVPMLLKKKNNNAAVVSNNKNDIEKELKIQEAVLAASKAFVEEAYKVEPNTLCELKEGQSISAVDLNKIIETSHPIAVATNVNGVKIDTSFAVKLITETTAEIEAKFSSEGKNEITRDFEVKGFITKDQNDVNNILPAAIIRAIKTTESFDNTTTATAYNFPTNITINGVHIDLIPGDRDDIQGSVEFSFDIVKGLAVKHGTAVLDGFHTDVPVEEKRENVQRSLNSIVDKVLTDESQVVPRSITTIASNQDDAIGTPSHAEFEITSIFERINSYGVRPIYSINGYGDGSITVTVKYVFDATNSAQKTYTFTGLKTNQQIDDDAKAAADKAAKANAIAQYRAVFSEADRTTETQLVAGAVLPVGTPSWRTRPAQLILGEIELMSVEEIIAKTTELSNWKQGALEYNSKVVAANDLLDTKNKAKDSLDAYYSSHPIDASKQVEAQAEFNSILSAVISGKTDIDSKDTIDQVNAAAASAKGLIGQKITAYNNAVTKNENEEKINALSFIDTLVPQALTNKQSEAQQQYDAITAAIVAARNRIASVNLVADINRVKFEEKDKINELISAFHTAVNNVEEAARNTAKSNLDALLTHDIETRKVEAQSQYETLTKSISDAKVEIDNASGVSDINAVEQLARDRIANWVSEFNKAIKSIDDTDAGVIDELMQKVENKRIPIAADLAIGDSLFSITDRQGVSISYSVTSISTSTSQTATNIEVTFSKGHVTQKKAIIITTGPMTVEFMASCMSEDELNIDLSNDINVLKNDNSINENYLETKISQILEMKFARATDIVKTHRGNFRVTISDDKTSAIVRINGMEDVRIHVINFPTPSPIAAPDEAIEAIYN